MTGTVADRGRRFPGASGAEPTVANHPPRRSEPVAGAPGWRVVERAQRPVPLRSPQLAPVRATRRPNALLPWTAGAVLSLLVLALTVVDERWLDQWTERSPAAPERPSVTAPLEPAAPLAPEADLARVPPEADPATAAPEADLATAAPEADLATGAPEADLATAAPEPEIAPFAKSPPKVVPISPDGRGTAGVGARPEPAVEAPEAPAQVRPVAPAQPAAGTPRVIPISMKRPQASSSPAVQLIGTAAADEGAGVDLSDLGREPAAGTPAGSDPAGVRLFIHYAATQAGDAATATRLAEYLRRRGFEVAGIRPVEFLIERPGVRFFFERDHADSERLLEDLGWFFRSMPHKAPERASDFTHYTPKPQPGTVEIWLPTAS